MRFSEEVSHVPLLGLVSLDGKHMPGKIFDDIQEVRVGFGVKLLSLQVESCKSVSVEKPTRKHVLAWYVGSSLATNPLFDVPFPLEKLLRGSTLKVRNGKVIFSQVWVARTGFALEGGAQGTPHLQGYVIFKTKVRLGITRVLLGGRAHCEIKRGTPQQASDYCKKEGLFSEHGSLPSTQGTRNDMVDAWDFILRHQEEHGDVPDKRALCMEFPSVYGHYRTNLLSMCAVLRKTPSFDTGALRPWQGELDEILKMQRDDRKIMFFIDAIGGAGKTWYQRYKLTTCDHVQLLSSGKRDDIAHAIDEHKSIFFFKVPRGGMEYMHYTVLEQIKDQLVFSPKYNSRTKAFMHKTHVCVFCNEPPDMNKMSADRYHLHYFDSVKLNIYFKILSLGSAK